jgi:uncharacterized protein (TIGR02246 family)
MRIIDLLSLTAMCICVASGCNTPPAHSNENDIAQIKEISAARAKAFNEGNAQAIAEYFTEDALLMAPGKPVSKGKKAVHTYYETIFNEYNTALESHYEEVEVSGSLAYGRGEAKVTITPKAGGAPSASTAKYLNILKKSNGVWKTTHDIWNGNE